jgi:hypothetical protein
MTDPSSLYQTDFSAWVQRQVELLRSGRFAELDVEHLLEELGDMGKSERRELQSRLLILLAHLLKWEHQFPMLSERWREFDGRSWRATILEQRKQLAILLRQSPGLKAIFCDLIDAAYPDAVDLASKETGLSPSTFASHCPYRCEQLLEDDFFPTGTV